MMFDLSAIRKSVQSLAGQVKSLRGEIESLKQQREDILNAPVAKVDVQAMIERWVESTRRAYAGKLRVTLEVAFRKPEDTINAANVDNRMTLVGASGQINGLTNGGRAIDGALCMFMGDQILSNLAKAFKAMDWPAGGLPISERQDAARKLDDKIGALQKEEAELVSAARAAGIFIEG